MKRKNSISSILEEYGLTVFSYFSPEDKASLLEKETSLTDFKKIVVDKKESLITPKTLPNYPLLWLLEHIFYTEECRITNPEQWKTAFDINVEDFPFPDEYLLKFIVFEHFSTNGKTFVTRYGDIYDLATAIEKTPEQVRIELVPSYAIEKVFIPEEALFRADEEVNKRIDKLDEFISNNEKLLDFVDELMECALQLIDEEPSIRFEWIQFKTMQSPSNT